MLNILKITLICISVLYIILLTALYFFQEKLIFFPQKLDSISANNISHSFQNVEEITLSVDSNVNVKGWLKKSGNPCKSPLIIYFGGNAEDVFYNLFDFKNSGWSVSLVNYRGYGQSDGRPDERSIFSDALKLYDYLVAREDIDTSRIVVMGRSIGSGVAVYLAQNRKVNGVVLVTPYDSVTSVAQEKYPIVPVRLILKNRFDSISRAPGIKVPALIITAENDITIPPWHAKKLADKWGGKVSAVEIKGEDHNSISTNQYYWKCINEFMKKMQG